MQRQALHRQPGRQREDRLTQPLSVEDAPEVEEEGRVHVEQPDVRGEVQRPCGGLR